MPNPGTSIQRNHHWLFERFIHSTDGVQLLLNLSFNPTQLSLIKADQYELLATKSMAPQGQLQDADILIKVPLKQTTADASSMRILIEVKSKVVPKALMLQLLRYHHGTLETDWTPVVTLTVSNDVQFKLDGQLHFSDCVDDAGAAFVKAFGSHMMDFAVTVVNLCAPRNQALLQASDSPAAIMLYAMGNINVEKHFSVAVAKTLVRKSAALNDAQLLEYWVPVVQYINDRKGLDYSWWLPLELEITGGRRMIDLSWSNDEVNQKVGEQRGIEIGRAEGRKEAKLTLAQAMLHDGIEKDFIKKYFDFSDDEVDALKNGQINNA